MRTVAPAGLYKAQRCGLEVLWELLSERRDALDQHARGVRGDPEGRTVALGETRGHNVAQCNVVIVEDTLELGIAHL